LVFGERMHPAAVGNRPSTFVTQVVVRRPKTAMYSMHCISRPLRDPCMQPGDRVAAQRLVNGDASPLPGGTDGGVTFPANAPAAQHAQRWWLLEDTTLQQQHQQPQQKKRRTHKAVLQECSRSIEAGQVGIGDTALPVAIIVDRCSSSSSTLECTQECSIYITDPTKETTAMPQQHPSYIQ
jgi:hypothetical protein